MMLEGTTAMVTGIGPGMGRDISLALAREGADVILVARSDKVVPGVAAEIEELGRRAFPVYGNIAKPEECERIAAEAHVATSTLGVERAGIDILVNSAFHGGEHVRFEDADLQRWRRPVDINYFGTLQLTQSVLPQLKLAAERIRRRPHRDDQHDVGPAPRGTRGVLRRVEGGTRCGHQDARVGAGGVRHPGQRDPPRVHLGRQRQDLLRVAGRGTRAGRDLAGRVRRARRGDRTRLPAALLGDRRARRCSSPRRSLAASRARRCRSTPVTGCDRAPEPRSPPESR